MELARSAPGVCAMSARLISTCGTGEEGFTVSGAPETSTVSWCCATASAKCISCTLLDVTVTDCCTAANPGDWIVTSYSPTGTFWSVAIPSSLVAPAILNADVRLCTSTCAPFTGRCCGSCTMALTVPNTDANAGKAASSASNTVIAIDRFNILIPRWNRKWGSVSLQLIDKPAMVNVTGATSISASLAASGGRKESAETTALFLGCPAMQQSMGHLA